MQKTAAWGIRLFIRFFTESWGKSSLEARLRTRKVTGRDASLPAPLLATSLGLVGRGTVGALPQTPQGTLSLDPARGRRKGTKSPLDPFSRLSWCAFMLLPRAAFWCFAEAFVCSPELSVKNQKIPRIVRDSGGDNAYRSPLRPRLRLTRRTGCPAFFFAPDAFVRATGLLAGALSTRTGVPPRRILPSLPMTTG